MSNIFEHTEQNRRAWNEIAAVRQRGFPPASFFAAGNSVLSPVALAAIPDARGRSLLHLQCSTGEETLSWAIAGAEATGVDISEEQIEIAIQKADAAGLGVRYVAADVYALPDDLQSGSFDFVYTGSGAVMWLPDITRWAQIVAAALRPGGRLILLEIHPVALCLWVTDGRLEMTGDYFGRESPLKDYGWGHFVGGEDARGPKLEFAWPLGDIVTAVARAGLRIETLQEYPSTEAYRFGEKLEEVSHLPGHYLLTARKA
jgi:SAM-dependent methyltransferase